MGPIEITRLLVIAGYALAAAMSWGFVFTTKSPVRRIGGSLIATFTSCWVGFYMWTSTINVVENLGSATLMSRLAHFPTIVGAISLIIILWDTERIARNGNGAA